MPYVIKKQVLVSGGDLTDAQPGFDQRTNEPIVNFKFNTLGLAQIRAGDDRRTSSSRSRSCSITR
mgnify:CR=1 FL=1